MTLRTDSRYVRTVNTFHRRDCNRMPKRADLRDWHWPENNPDVDVIEYGRRVIAEGRSGYVKPCKHCFPECFVMQLVIGVTDG